MKKDIRNNVIGISIVVALITVVAKVIGFGREAIIAAYYGATKDTDAYFLARNMPALIFPAVCSSISTAFLSVYVSMRSEKKTEEADAFVSRALNVTLLISFLLSMLALLLSPLFVPLFAPGFDPETTKLAIKLTRITMAAFSFIMLEYMLAAILNSKKIFFSAQIAGVFNNVFIILITIFSGKNNNVIFLTWTVIGGLILQVIILGFCARKEFRYRFLIGFRDEYIINMMRLSVPILLGNSIVQLSSIVDKILASGLGEGVVSSISYTNSLNSVVTSVFIVSLSTVLYPTLTENASKHDKARFSKNLLENLIMLVLVITPISLVTAVFSKDIITIVYYHGEFSSSAAEFTANALAYYAAGYVFIAVREIIIRGFYAVGNSKTPMTNGVISVSLSILFSILLSGWMGIRGIAFGNSLAAGISAFLLVKSMNKKLDYIDIRNIWPTLRKTIISGLVTFVALFITSKFTAELSSYLSFVIGTVTGFVIYIISLRMMKCYELLKFIQIIKNNILIKIKDRTG